MVAWIDYSVAVVTGAIAADEAIVPAVAVAVAAGQAAVAAVVEEKLAVDVDIQPTSMIDCQ